MLVTRVLLRCRALHEKVRPRSQHRAQITLHLRLEALETAELIEKRAWDDEDVFHGKRACESGPPFPPVNPHRCIP